MIGVFAFVAFALRVGVLVALVVVALIYLIIGAVVWAGNRRPDA
jgi:hypothetical protein